VYRVLGLGYEAQVLGLGLQSLTPTLAENVATDAEAQGCSFGLERLGLEAVSRHFLERLGLVSVLKI